MDPSDVDLLVRIAAGFALAYLLGFERQLRGSAAGNRTFSMVGAAAAAVTSVTARSSPQAVAGVVTGVGFIGAGVVFRRQGGLIRGVTTAATIFAASAIGVVVGYGHLLVASVTTALLLLTLEMQHLPFLRWLDASAYSGRFNEDRAEPGDEDGRWEDGQWVGAPGSSPASSSPASSSPAGSGPPDWSPAGRPAGGSPPSSGPADSSPASGGPATGRPDGGGSTGFGW